MRRMVTRPSLLALMLVVPSAAAWAQCVGPLSGCKIAEKSRLLLKDKTPDKGDKLVWKWTKGSELGFADPTAGNGYELCVYEDDGGGGATSVSSHVVPASAVAAGTWQARSGGFRYTDKTLAEDGIRTMRLKPGSAKAKIQARGGGANLSLAGLGLALPVTAQLFDGTTCWESVFDSAMKNESGQFKAKRFGQTIDTIGLDDIDCTASPNGVVAMPATVDPALLIFDKYTKVSAPNGGRIHILGQANVSGAQMIRARMILEFYLTDAPGTAFGTDKAAVANSMASNNATLVFFNTESEAASAFNGPLGDLSLGFQDLYATESVITGSPEYLDHSLRDASFEEIFHLVHGFGIQPVLPAYQAQIQAAQVNARPMAAPSPSDIWTIDQAFYSELAAEGSLTHEYVISVIDVYYGLWAHVTGPSFDGEYVPNDRGDLPSQDPMGLAAVEAFLPENLTFHEDLDPSFTGTFTLTFDAGTSYTNKSQYLQDVALTGTNNANLTGNALDNTLAGNAGDNRITGEAGNDIIDGGDGSDTAVYSGLLADYDVVSNAGVATVTDNVGADGSDTVSHTEFLEFSDQTISVSP